MIDQDKRDTIVKLSALAAAPCIVLSTGVEAANQLSSPEGAKGSVPVPASLAREQPDVVLSVQSPIKTLDGATLCRVSLSNHSTEEIELKSVYPGVFRAAEGLFDVNQRLKRGGVKVGPGGEYYFWLTADTVSRISKHPVETPESNGRQIHIKVVTQLDHNDAETHAMASTALAVLV